MNLKSMVWTVFGVLILGSILSALQFYHLTNEDAWISFKYARNLADGYGLVSNPGDTTQEGYSNLVLVLLLAFFKWAFAANIVHAAKFIGVMSNIAILLSIPIIVKLLLTSLKRYLKAIGDHRLEKYENHYFYSLVLFMVAAIGFSQYLGLWATQGLETTLYALTIWSIVYFTLRAVITRRYEGVWIITILCFLSVNIRPEGLMNFFVVVGCIFLAALTENKLNRHLFAILLRNCLLFGLLVAGLLSFRYCYFGHLLANPSYVKLAVAEWLDWSTYFADYLNAKGLSFIVVTAIAIGSGIATSFLFFKEMEGKAIVHGFFVCLAFLASQAFFIYFSGGDYMEHSRFIVTHYPLLILAITWGTVMTLGQLPRKVKTYPIVSLVVIMSSVVIVSALREVSDRPAWWHWSQFNYVSPTVFHEKVLSGYHLSVQRLAAKMFNESGYYALSEFGYVPYHVAAKGLDIMGLNQKEIAYNFKLYGREEALYANRDLILSKKPTVIVTGKYYRQNDGKIYLHPAVAWFFKPYVDSEFFWRNYTTQVPDKLQNWIFSDWNGHFVSTQRINASDVEHDDKLLYGFYREGSQVWVAPLARILLTRRAQDRFLHIEGFIPDTRQYPQHKHILEIRVNDKAVGDKLFASQMLEQMGVFSFKIPVDDLAFPVGDQLLTMRGSQLQIPTDDRKLSFVLQAIYFSEN